MFIDEGDEHCILVPPWVIRSSWSSMPGIIFLFITGWDSSELNSQRRDFLTSESLFDFHFSRDSKGRFFLLFAASFIALFASINFVNIKLFLRWGESKFVPFMHVWSYLWNYKPKFKNQPRKTSSGAEIRGSKSSAFPPCKPTKYLNALNKKPVLPKILSNFPLHESRRQKIQNLLVLLF